WTNGHFLDSRVTVTALARSRRCPWLHRRKTGTEPDTRARIGAVRLPGGTSDARGDGLHEAGRQAHQGGYGRRQVDTPGHPRVAGVAHLVRLHLLEDAPAAFIVAWQALQMAIQVCLHLALGLDHEAQAQAVADQTGRGADGEGAGIPERIEQAGAVAQLLQAVG